MQRSFRTKAIRDAWGERFMRDHDVQVQRIPPILTLSGEVFERQVEQAVAARYPTSRFDDKDPDDSDNETIAELARELAPGEVHVTFQPRLEATLGQWRIRGNAGMCGSW